MQMLNQLHTRTHVHAVVQIYIAACMQTPRDERNLQELR